MSNQEIKRMTLKKENLQLREENTKLKEELETLKSLFFLQEKVRSMLLVAV